MQKLSYRHKYPKTSRAEINRHIGYVPQDIAVFNELTAIDNMRFFARLYGLRGKELKTSVREALEFTGKLKLVKLKYPNMQSTSPLPEEAFVYKLNKKEVDIKYISLTDLAKKFSDASPSYVVQSWMRSSNTIELLNLWEQRHNDKYSMDGYDALVVRLKTGTLTMTPKQWIVQTGAIGITSKSGKNGGTYAHPLLACEFMMWLSPTYKLALLEMRSDI